MLAPESLCRDSAPLHQFFLPASRAGTGLSCHAAPSSHHAMRASHILAEASSVDLRAQMLIFAPSSAVSFSSPPHRRRRRAAVPAAVSPYHRARYAPPYAWQIAFRFRHRRALPSATPSPVHALKHAIAVMPGSPARAAFDAEPGREYARQPARHSRQREMQRGALRRASAAMPRPIFAHAARHAPPWWFYAIVLRAFDASRQPRSSASFSNAAFRSRNSTRHAPERDSRPRAQSTPDVFSF